MKYFLVLLATVAIIREFMGNNIPNSMYDFLW